MQIIKNRFWAIIVFMILFVISSIFISGCSNNENKSFSGGDIGESINLSMIYCNRQNSSAGFQDDFVGEYVMSYLKDKNNTLSAYTTDGEPRAIDIEEVKTSKRHTEKNVNSDNKKATQKFCDIMKSTNAEKDECNLVSAINKASNSFTSNNGNSNVLIICDSGISTSGILNFTKQNILAMNASDYSNIAKSLDMTKVNRIIWIGFNNVCGEQKEIQTENEKGIKQFYNDFFKLAGYNGSEIEFNPSSSYSNRQKYFSDDKSLPSVSTVQWPETDSQYANFSTGKTNSIKLDETQLKFEPDSTNFVNEEQAASVLSKVAGTLKDNNSLMVDVNGYIASNTAEVGNLSQRRADTVKSKLVDLGVSSSNITAYGKGPGPYPYLDESNNINSANRYIEIVKK